MCARLGNVSPLPSDAPQPCIPRKSKRLPRKRPPTNAAQMQQVTYEWLDTTVTSLDTFMHMPCLSAVVQAQALACANGCCAG